MQGNPRTVGELRKLIAKLPDDTAIVQRTRDGEYYYVPEDAIEIRTFADAEDDDALEGQDISFGQTALVIWLDQ